MNRRLLRTALLLALAATAPAAAQLQRVITDKAPSAVVAEPGAPRVHVLTAGVDVNFNGVLELDSGDVAPQWAVIDTRTNVITDSTTLDDFFNSFPIRVGFDFADRRLYAAQAGRIRAFDIDELAVVDDTVALGDYSGVSYDPVTGILVGHMRPGFTSVGYIVGLLPETGDTIGVFQTGVNPQMSIVTIDPSNRGVATYTVSEGSFGTPSSVLSYASGNPDVYGAINGGPLGSGVRDFITYAGENSIIAVAALTASNQVRIIDSRTHRATRTIPVPSPTAVGYDATSGAIVVGTAGGLLIRFDPASGVARDTVALPGMAGAIKQLGSTIAVAIPFTDPTMSQVDSLVVIVDAASGRAIDTVAVGPQPTSMFFDPAANLHVIGRASDGSLWWRRLDRSTFEPGEIASLGSVGIQGDIAYDAETDSLFVVVRSPLSNRFVVAAHSTAGPLGIPRLVYEDPTAAGELAGVSVGPVYLLVLERSTNPSKPEGYVHVIRRSTGERVIKAIVGIDPMRAAFVGPSLTSATSLYIINRESGEATLSHIAFDQDLLGPDTLGSGANHMLAPELAGPVAITMNGSHTLVLVDLLRSEIVRRIPLGTSGFDGPREAVELLGSIEPEYAVTTYAGDVRIVAGSGVNRIVATGGKAEGIARVGGLLYVANTFTPTYAADSTVVIIDLNASGVDGDEALAGRLEQNAPNPATDRTRIRFSVERAGAVRLELRTLVGQLVAVPLDRIMDAGDYAVEIPLGDVPGGSYLYTLRAGDVIESRVMQVVR